MLGYIIFYVMISIPILSLVLVLDSRRGTRRAMKEVDRA